MTSRRITTLLISIFYGLITASYVAENWIDAPEGFRGALQVALLVLVAGTCALVTYLFKKALLVRCFVVGVSAFSLVYAASAVVSEDYRGLILPSLAIIAFLLVPDMRKWIADSSQPSGD